MGYQPALDGLRALSVALVILYHAGVVHNSTLPTGVPKPWFFNGGFLGVEVFFVVSGYLITTLLFEERERTGTVSLRKFWGRRFRRLIPALWVMIVVASVWAMVWGRAYLSDLRHDIPFAISYTSNFQQLFRKVSYFEGVPHLLRHLWSLAVEEHFYLLFPPLLMLVLRRRTGSRRTLLWVVVPAALASIIGLVAVWQRPFERLADTGTQLDDLRQNWAYLSTLTRVGGILIGVALAVVWSPWAKQRAGESVRKSASADVLGLLAVSAIVALSMVLSNESALLYRGGLTLVSLLSAVAIGTSVHPGARVMRALFGNKAMAAIGRRSYGLYIWHWPIFVGPLGGRATWVRVLIGIPATLAVSELCYRFVETPVRTGWLLPRLRRHAWSTAVASCVVVGALAVGVTVINPTDHRTFTDDQSAEGVVPSDSTDPTVDDSLPLVTDTAASTTSRPSAVTDAVVDGAPSSTAAPAPTTTLPSLPRRVIAVGDSTAGAFARNVPRDIRDTFRFVDGQLSGCSVNDRGVAVGVHKTGRDFRVCKNWANRWATKATKAAAEIAIVVIGAWDVFDIDYGKNTVVFASPEFDATFKANLRSGIDLLLGTGTKVALLEVPCYRPHFTGGPGTFVFPERGDDTRTRHLNELLHQIADADPKNVTFISGPQVWCTDDKIATNYSLRYDGVHYTPQGAAIVYKAIKDQLLAIPVDAAQHAKHPHK
jgi:hypothetical protein